MKKLLLPALLMLLCVFSSCRVFYPDLMFKTDPEFQFDTPDTTAGDYVLQPGDDLSMFILSNNGYQLVDVIGTMVATVPVRYVVASTGFASLPLLDSVKIAGLTILELEQELKERYSYYFLNPFIQIRVYNKRAIVYTGRSVGKVVPLNNDRMQLVEVLAAAGGITGNKAYRIKVIRGDIKNPKVYLFDYSTIEGLKQGDFLVTNEDIVYVEPSLSLADVNTRIAPILSVLTTFILIYTAIDNIGNK